MTDHSARPSTAATSRCAVPLNGTAAVAARDALATPLYDPATDGPHWIPPVDIALASAREALARYEGHNIHSHGQMVTAATGLDSALRSLVGALDAEAAQPPGAPDDAEDARQFTARHFPTVTEFLAAPSAAVTGGETR
ncbi:hypothetical protein ACIQNU_03445 [Streptomyces sp. NPDC091292]|uniref:hypothetical protein n=1 Tax=Streptomyces sp. NPDC091292 TaxID=3365991 RepID=UPI003801D4BF